MEGLHIRHAKTGVVIRLTHIESIFHPPLILALLTPVSSDSRENSFFFGTDPTGTFFMLIRVLFYNLHTFSQELIGFKTLIRKHSHYIKK